MFISHDYLVAIRETVRILEWFNFLKGRGDPRGRSSLKAWKFFDAEEQNVWGDAFYMEHRAELKKMWIENPSENGNVRESLSS